eukprot:6203639-Pleurochrysis_carterae.AAC.3
MRAARCHTLPPGTTYAAVAEDNSFCGTYISQPLQSPSTLAQQSSTCTACVTMLRSHAAARKML